MPFLWDAVAAGGKVSRRERGSLGQGKSKEALNEASLLVSTPCDLILNNRRFVEQEPCRVNNPRYQHFIPTTPDPSLDIKHAKRHIQTASGDTGARGPSCPLAAREY